MTGEAYHDAGTPAADLGVMPGHPVTTLIFAGVNVWKFGLSVKIPNIGAAIRSFEFSGSRPSRISIVRSMLS